MINDLFNSPEIQEEYRRQFPYNAIALAIVDVRGRLQITQKQLADLVGTTEAVISKVESGKTPISTAFLKRIADATNSDIVLTLKERY